ncbi:MAG TPA: GWxTD domain-containing protein [Bacteroidia bacterium]|jgi:GWxTD domain-containing protein|nr:GWxTD domain-containing protein [Bacteroidia bacterium]
MKRLFSVLLPLFLICSCLHAQELSALLLWKSFSTPDNKPYVETYLSVSGNTAVYVKTVKGKKQASIDIGITFSQGNSIKAYKKYVLSSPEIPDSVHNSYFIDQQRFGLEKGDYLMELTLTDKNKPGAKAFTKKENIHIGFSSEKTEMSDIELVESYEAAPVPGVLTKNGYDIHPYVANFYPENMDKLQFYAEVYNTSKTLGPNEKFILLYYIETYTDAQKLNAFGGFIRETAQPVVIALASLPIDKLPSGEYNLVLEARDKDNKIISFNKTYFGRGKSDKQTTEAILAAAENDISSSFAARFTNKDTLIDLIRSTKPISSDVEASVAENDIKTKDVKILQKRLFIFWSTHHPVNPELAFEQYNEQVQAVQHTFGTKMRRGYNTDRGRVYLHYGAPSVRQVNDNEPSAYPYEIWTYYRLADKQTNRRFVFYEPDLVTNDFRLIHSDAIGEIFDANWDIKIHKRNTQGNNLDTETAPDHYGGNSLDDFNHPK